MDSAIEAPKPVAVGATVRRLKPGPAGQAKDERAWVVYRTIVEACQESGGIPPVIDELAGRCGLASRSAIHKYLRVLEDYGLVRIDRNLARGIHVVGSSWSPPPAFALMNAARSAEAA